MSDMHDDKAATELIPEAYFSEKKQGSKGCVFGCLGCFGVIVLGLIVVIGVGYYSVFYSSAPLKLVEAMIEGNEGVEIRGLSGTISSGFHVEEITFQNDSVDQLSKIENVEFRFNGIGELFRDDRRLIIEEFSVGSGTVYFRSDPESEFDMQSIEQDLEVAPPDGTQTTNSGESVDFFQEVRIDLIEFSELTFIDLETGKTSELKDAVMSDFHYLDGSVQNVGEYSIEGLTTYSQSFEMENFCGNPSGGFSIDRFRVKNSQGEWSDVKDLQFEFNGIVDMLENKQLVIDRLSAESGVFYIDPSWETKEDEVIVEEVAATPLGLEKVLIKEISFPNLKFINTATELEFNVNEMSFRDLEFNEDSIVSLGEIRFEADNIQLETEISDSFQDQPSDVLKQRISGVLGADLHADLKRKVDFQIDLCFVDKWKPLVQLEMCGGQIIHVVNKDVTVTTWRDFQATDWLAISDCLVPGKIDGTWQTEKQADTDKELTTVNGTIRFGDLDFEILETELIEEEDRDFIGPVLMKGMSTGTGLEGELYLLKEKPFLALKLSKESVRLHREGFAKALWGIDYADLNAEQISQAKANSIALAKIAAIESGEEQESSAKPESAKE